MMSELKATAVYDVYWKANSVGEGTGTQVYLKSEADKVVAHHKYKRCLAIAMWCKSKSEIYNEFAADASEYMPSYEARFRSKAVLYQKWAMRWLELAEKFKDKEA
jgi:hypothetical protein